MSDPIKVWVLDSALKDEDESSIRARKSKHAISMRACGDKSIPMQLSNPEEHVLIDRKNWNDLVKYFNQMDENEVMITVDEILSKAGENRLEDE